MQEKKISHILLYWTCEQMVFGVGQLQKEELGQTTQESTRARQPMKELCTRVRHHLTKDLLHWSLTTPFGLLTFFWKIFVLDLDNSQWINLVGMNSSNLEERVNEYSWKLGSFNLEKNGWLIEVGIRKFQLGNFQRMDVIHWS